MNESDRPTPRPHRGRVRIVRSLTISHRNISRKDLAENRYILDEVADIPRPSTRGDCADVPRPCPYVGCRHHLYLDASRGGSIRFAFPDIAPEEMPAESSCSLDIAEQGECSLEQIGHAMNVTRERIRQIETIATRKLRKHKDTSGE